VLSKNLNKKSLRAFYWNIRRIPGLFDCNFSTGDAFASKEANAASRELHDAITSGVDSVVAAEAGAFASALSQTDLTNDNLAGFDSLATKQLNTKALTLAVAGIFGGTAGFHM